jgi:hypothetical protein
MTAQSIEYQKVMTEIVHVNLPGPQEPTPGMTGGELLHGFLAELHDSPNQEFKNITNLLCARWNVHYRESRGG